MSHNSQCIYR